MISVNREVEDIFSEEEVDWRKYARWLKEATGRSSDLANEILNDVGQRLKDSKLVSAVNGYMIEVNGTLVDFIGAYAGHGSRTKIVREEDAQAFAVALGLERYSLVSVSALSGKTKI